MNNVIELLKAHRSIRRFSDKPIPREMLEEIIRAGQAASTSSFIQATSVIRISNPATREQLAELAGNQKYVATAAEFRVYCADLSRARECCKVQDVEPREGFAESFIIATVDTALMAQNVAIAAESLGLGICYIGGLRNSPQEVSDLLGLPDQVYPVFGFCMGYPDQQIDLRPRLPLPIVLKQEHYSTDDSATIAEYDRVVERYYAKRLGGNKSMSWTQQVAGLAGKEARPHMLSFLQGKGFLKR